MLLITRYLRNLIRFLKKIQRIPVLITCKVLIEICNIERFEIVFVFFHEPELLSFLPFPHLYHSSSSDSYQKSFEEPAISELSRFEFFEAAGALDCVDVVAYEVVTHNNHTTLATFLPIFLPLLIGTVHITTTMSLASIRTTQAKSNQKSTSCDQVFCEM